ncbi:trypsin-like peptidase domain-containing protein [Azospirillum lipoferum]|uniref:Serine protease n=1 Tax=Azospirillum lipoferum (strain 4B) TaxID=862719 RepID=G7ZGJ6_AZOL4|nr:trypsin-like peptidase domain-containing protein [Azospirillum lipoferum]CBS90928.1 Putative serine protease [Azospirillum lipoferum 4B]
MTELKINRTFRVCGAFAAAAFCTCALVSGAVRAFDVKSVEQSVVRLVRYSDNQQKAFGTGFVVSNGGYIATNRHVVGCNSKEKCHVKMFVQQGSTQDRVDLLSTELIALDLELDLALLRLNNTLLHPLPLAMEEPEKGARVHAFGFPVAGDTGIGGSGLSNPTLTEGIISRVETGRWDTSSGSTLRLVQHTANINRGNSGGPLLDDCGRVVGINTALPRPERLPDGTFLQPNGIYFASHAGSLADLLKRSNLSFEAQSSSCVPAAAPNSIVIWLVTVLSTAALAAATIAFVRRPQLITETYSQWMRRQPRPSGTCPPRKDQRGNDDPSPRWQIRGTDGNGQPVHFVIDEALLKESSNGLIVGSNEQVAEKVINDDTVSGQHARFTIVNGILHIEDLKSTNKVSIDGGRPIDPLVPKPLSAGAEIELGETRLKVLRI